MDWTMIGNAKGPLQRVQTVIYLCRMRYEAGPEEAGIRLSKEPPSNLLWQQTLKEIRSELTAPSGNLGIGSLINDEEAREYLEILVSSYDAALSHPSEQ